MEWRWGVICRAAGFGSYLLHYVEREGVEVGVICRAAGFWGLSVALHGDFKPIILIQRDVVVAVNTSLIL